MKILLKYEIVKKKSFSWVGNCQENLVFTRAVLIAEKRSEIYSFSHNTAKDKVPQSARLSAGRGVQKLFALLV